MFLAVQPAHVERPSTGALGAERPISQLQRRSVSSRKSVQKGMKFEMGASVFAHRMSFFGCVTTTKHIGSHSDLVGSNPRNVHRVLSTKSYISVCVMLHRKH